MSYNQEISKTDYMTMTGSGADENDNGDSDKDKRSKNEQNLDQVGTSEDRYHGRGEVLLENAYLNTEARAQQIQQPPKQEEFRAFMARRIQDAEEAWHQQQAQKLDSQFAESPTNEKLKFKKGSLQRARAYTGREAAEAEEAEKRRHRRAQSIDLRRSQIHKAKVQEEVQAAVESTRQTSEDPFDGDDFQHIDDFGPIDDLAELSAAGELLRPNNARSSLTNNTDSDLEFLGTKPMEQPLDSTIALTSGNSQPAFRIPPSLPPKPDSQSKSQFFDIDDVLNPTPLTSLSQVKNNEIDLLPALSGATRSARGVPRKKTAAQRMADAEKAEREARKADEKALKETRARKNEEKLMKPRKEDVSQIE